MKVNRNMTVTLIRFVTLFWNFVRKMTVTSTVTCHRNIDRNNRNIEENLRHELGTP